MRMKNKIGAEMFIQTKVKQMKIQRRCAHRSQNTLTNVQLCFFPRSYVLALCKENSKYECWQNMNNEKGLISVLFIFI